MLRIWEDKFAIRMGMSFLWQAVVYILELSLWQRHKYSVLAAPINSASLWYERPPNSRNRIVNKNRRRQLCGIYLKENWISSVALKFAVKLMSCVYFLFLTVPLSPSILHPENQNGSLWPCRIKQPKDWDISKLTVDHNKVSRRRFIGWVHVVVEAKSTF